MARVFVNGTFDVLHVGHVRLLQFAKSQGHWLLVAIDSDRRVKQLKGLGRPVNNQFERRTLLEAIKYVDQVKIFDTDQELRTLIAGCTLMVKGSDYRNLPIIGSDICPVIFFERIDDYSTTKKIQHIAAGR